jgi:hypothetical protein
VILAGLGLRAPNKALTFAGCERPLAAGIRQKARSSPPSSGAFAPREPRDRRA